MRKVECCRGYGSVDSRIAGHTSTCDLQKLLTPDSHRADPAKSRRHKMRTFTFLVLSFLPTCLWPSTTPILPQPSALSQHIQATALPPSLQCCGYCASEEWILYRQSLLISVLCALLLATKLTGQSLNPASTGQLAAMTDTAITKSS